MSCKGIKVNPSPKMDDNAHPREKARKIVGKHYEDSDPNLRSEMEQKRAAFAGSNYHENFVE